jgi:hypothetical protein
MIIPPQAGTPAELAVETQRKEDSGKEKQTPDSYDDRGPVVFVRIRPHWRGRGPGGKTWVSHAVLAVNGEWVAALGEEWRRHASHCLVGASPVGDSLYGDSRLCEYGRTCMGSR